MPLLLEDILLGCRSLFLSEAELKSLFYPPALGESFFFARPAAESGLRLPAPVSFCRLERMSWNALSFALPFALLGDFASNRKSSIVCYLDVLWRVSMFILLLSKSNLKLTIDKLEYMY